MWHIQLIILIFIVCTIFLSSSTLINTSSLSLQSVCLIFFVLLQHHISDCHRYFWSFFQSVQVSAPFKVLLQMVYFIIFVLKFKPNFLVKRVCCFFHDNLGFNSMCIFCITYHATQIAGIFHILPLFLMYHNLYCGWLPWDSHHLIFLPTFISIS